MNPGRPNLSKTLLGAMVVTGLTFGGSVIFCLSVLLVDASA
jgi:hypothetical protein